MPQLNLINVENLVLAIAKGCVSYKRSSDELDLREVFPNLSSYNKRSNNCR
jgi:hypothetical protein